MALFCYSAVLRFDFRGIPVAQSATPLFRWGSETRIKVITDLVKRVLADSMIMKDQNHTLVTLGDNESLIGAEAVDRIHDKARPLCDLHVANVNSTYYGGGVAELLSSLTLLMNSVGIKTGWRVLQGSPDFFSVTKKMHNALQGMDINLTERKKQLYEQVIYENAVRNHLDHDMVVIHDPQPLPMVTHYKKKGPWIWRCHLDLSASDAETWNYLLPFIEAYDALVFSINDYRQKTAVPQRFFMPAINPF